MARAEVTILINDETGRDKFKEGDRGLIDGYVFNQEAGDVQAIVIVNGRFVSLPLWEISLFDLDE